MTATVQIPRTAAEAIASHLHEVRIAVEALGDLVASLDTGGVLDAGRVLDAALTDAAEAAAWEPLRDPMGIFAEALRSNPSSSSAADQRAMHLIAAFERVGLNLRDPHVLRPAIAALMVTEIDARPCTAHTPGVNLHLGRVAAAMATLVPSEVLR